MSKKPNHLSLRSLEICIGPTTQPRKTNCYRSIDNKQKSKYPGPDWASFFKRKNDAVQRKPKGSCRVDSLSETQESHQNYYLEHQNNVWSRENSTSGEWDEALQHLSLRTVWDEVAAVRTDKIKHRRNAAVFRTHWGGSPPHRGRRTDAIPGGTESSYWIETC